MIYSPVPVLEFFVTHDTSRVKDTFSLLTCLLPFLAVMPVAHLLSFGAGSLQPQSQVLVSYLSLTVFSKLVSDVLENLVYLGDHEVGYLVRFVVAPVFGSFE